MNIPPPFDPQQTTSVLQSIAAGITRLAPPGWQQVVLEFREVGLYPEAWVQNVLPDGSRQGWEVPMELIGQLNLLRLGMRANGRWHACTVTVNRTENTGVDFVYHAEPRFQGVCPVAQYRAELREVYRDADSVPVWLLTRAVPRDNPLASHRWFATEDGDDPALCGGTAPIPQDMPDSIRDAILQNDLPEDWSEVRYTARVIGMFQEHRLTGGRQDGGPGFALPVPRPLIQAATKVRYAESAPERGAWFTFEAVLHRDGTASARRDYETEPTTELPVPPGSYADELEYFPRPAYAIPDWLHARLPGPPAKPPSWAPALRQANLFDTYEPARDRHLTNRPALGSEAEKVHAYLKAGALVLTARTTTRNEFFRDLSNVPLAFRTDGTWIWPEAAAHYLKAVGMPPQSALLDHIRAARYTPPPVAENAIAAARTQLSEWIDARVNP